MTVADQIKSEERLAEALGEYAGKWVAVKDFEVVAHAPALEDLLDQITGKETEVEVFQAAEANVACFY